MLKIVLNMVKFLFKWMSLLFFYDVKMLFICFFLFLLTFI